MIKVESTEYYSKIKKFVEKNPDADDEDIYRYLLSIFPMRGDEYGVPEFAPYELDHVEVKEDKIIFSHRGITGDVNYDGSFILKEGNKKPYAW